MDEATSALDTETELSIQKNIQSLRGNYTMVVVAHRLSTIKNADQIIILKHGEVHDIGTFNELLNRSTLFRRMVKLQNF